MAALGPLPGTEGPSCAPELWMPMEKPRSSRWASSDRHSMRGPCRWGAIWGKLEHHKGLEKRAWSHFGLKTGALQLLQQSQSLIMKLDSLGLHE